MFFRPSERQERNQYPILSLYSATMFKSSYHIILIFVLIISCDPFNKCIAQSSKNLNALPTDSKTIRESHLEPLLELIGNARIIATTEAEHGMNEPLHFRNALIKLLVRKKIIEVVIIESGITESRLLYDYVIGNQPGNINDVLYNGLSWQFHVLPQNEEMVEWLKSYNADLQNSHKVRLYGFDMPGSPTNHLVHRKMNTALISVLEYLKKVDADGYQQFSSLLLPYVDYLHINFTNHTSAEKQYIDLTVSQREKLNLHVQQLIQYMEVNEIIFIERSSGEDYEWSYNAALNMRHIVNLANYIPTDYKMVSDDELEDSELMRKIVRYRDRVMVDNIEWVLKREGDSRVLLFAGTNHLLKIPMTIMPDSVRSYTSECAGNYLSRRYETDYVVIGNMVAEEGEPNRLENAFIDDRHAHYYKKMRGVEMGHLRTTSKVLNYNSGKKKLDITKAIDIILFDKTQTPVKFRGN